MPVLPSGLDTAGRTYQVNRRVQLDVPAALEEQLGLVRDRPLPVACAKAADRAW
jgi:hypothetical protein